MTKWEYKIESRSLNLDSSDYVENILNRLGKEGWELVNIIPEYTNTINAQEQVDSISVKIYSFVFKREN